MEGRGSRVGMGYRCIGVAAVLVIAAGALHAQPRLRMRPITELIAAQGTFCIDEGTDEGRGGCTLMVPPVANFVGWMDDAAGLAASVDYAGLANDYIVSRGGASLGTSVEGTVVERALGDGRAEVTVRIHTRNALIWVVRGFDFAGGRVLLGNRAPDVLAGAAPVLGDASLDVVFINTAPGAPLPDLVQLLFFPEARQQVRYLSFRAHAQGPLRAAPGIRVGAPGRVEIQQTSMFVPSPLLGTMVERVSAERIRIDVLDP
jgi:hypothetical protein